MLRDRRSLQTVFFGVPDHDHHHCPGLVVGPVELRLPESDGCEVDVF